MRVTCSCEGSNKDKMYWRIIQLVLRQISEEVLLDGLHALYG